VKMKRNTSCLRVPLMALCFVGAMNAGTVSILPDVSGTGVIASSITTFATTGADMLGMLVSVNGGAAATWTTCGAGCGQATGTLGDGTWTLTVTGNTGNVSSVTNPDGTALTPWTLTSTSTTVAITSVLLDGVPGSTLFDRDRVTYLGPPTGGQEGTPNSSFGIDYTFASEAGQNAPYAVGVTYSNLVTLAGAPQACNGAAFGTNTTATGCGDLWGQLSFTFAPGAFIATTTGKNHGDAVWSFFQDTDNGPGITFVPEPLTSGLMALGFLAIMAHRKRRSSGA
jgi:hypothetical protein